MKQLLKKYVLAFYFFITIVYLEFFLLINTNEPIFIKGMLITALFSLSYALLLFFVVSILPRKSRGIVGGVFLFVITLLFSAQLVYYDLFKTFFTVFSAAKGGMVLEFLSDIVVFVGRNIHWILIMFLPLIMYALVLKGVRIKDKMPIAYKIMALLVSASMFLLALVPINTNQNRNSPYDFYYKTFLINRAVNSFGLLTTMRLDFKRTVFGSGNNVNIPDLTPELSPTPTATVTPTPGDINEPDPTLKPIEFNVLNIDFDKLIENESNPVIKNMHQYFKSASTTTKNDYTGMFEGYNLIFITAESYAHYAIDEDVTPTLYKMTHEGFNFTNFYNPIWGVSTSDGEYVATTGLLPKAGVWSMYLSGYNSMPFAMGNQLMDLGYETLAYHNHTYEYYRRDISHPNLGYIYKGIGNGLEMPYTWPSSDLDMMIATIDEYIDNEPFHAYYMTVSGHMRYNFTGNFIAAKNKNLVEDLPLSTPSKAYMATQIELDRALEYLLEEFEKAGVADKTLFVMSSDHYPYGLTHEQIEELSGKSVDRNFELYRSSLILYSPSMEPQVIEKPCSSLDIIPTISNLMGIPYDSRLLMGQDILSDSEPLVIFLNRSFISDKGRYNAETDTFTPVSGANFNDYGSIENYVDRMLEIIERKFYYSEQILNHDYYSILMD